MRDNELNEYYHRVADHVKQVFLDQYNIKGTIVGGPGPTKENFLKEEYLDYRLQKSVIASLDTSYSGGEGVRELMKGAPKRVSCRNSGREKNNDKKSGLKCTCRDLDIWYYDVSAGKWQCRLW